MFEKRLRNNILLAFDSHFAGLAYGRLAAEGDVVVVFDYFGTDEAFFKVGVYDTCAARSLGTAAESPCAHFVGAGCEECLKVEQGICRTYQTGDTRLLQAD